MATINAAGPASSVFAQSLSCKGPLVIPVQVDMTAEIEGAIDFTQAIGQGTIDFISGLYCDNLDGAEDIDFICSGTLMRYRVYAGRQQFVQLLTLTPCVISWSTPGGINNCIVPMFFSNIPFLPFSNQP
jgi:hypothetical protein